MWNLAPPPGFAGLDPHKPLTVYHRLLPHWRQEGATYFVTFRLSDSLPRSKLDELQAFKREWQFKQALANSQAGSWDGSPEPSAVEIMMRDELAKQLQMRIDRWLDQGMGECLLEIPAFASFLTTAMHHFDDSRYELGCYVVMPNHVHAIVRPYDDSAHSLEEILGSWKKYSARRINHTRKKPGELWQDESYDRIIRDEEHLWRTVQYIGGNPERAGLAQGRYVRWVRPNWVAAGWGFST